MSLGGDGRTRNLVLCAKEIDGFVEAILFLIGRALEGSKLVTQFLDGSLGIRYFFVR